MKRFHAAAKDFFRRADIFLLVMAILCAVFGIVVISSATASYPQPMKYVIVQVASMLIGIVAFVAMTVLDIDVLADKWFILSIFNVVFLLLLIPFGVDDGTGNRSWFRFFGIGIQPTEIVKLTFIIILAKQIDSLKRSTNGLNAPLSAMQLAVHFVLVFGLIPVFIPANPSWFRLYSLIFLLGASSFLGAAINVCWFPWFSDLAPISIRGRWLSIRDTVISVISVGMGLVIAWLLDTLPAETRYIIIFLIGGAFGMMDMISFGFCKEVYSAPPQKLHIKKVMAHMFRDKPFVHFLIMWTAWCFTANMGGVYMTPYVMQVMGLSAMQIMIFATIAASVATVLCISRWGRAMDKYGCKSVMLVTCIVASLTPAFYVFQTPGSIWPTLLHNFIGAAFWCGANLAANSMQLSSSPDDLRPTYIAVFSCFDNSAIYIPNCICTAVRDFFR